MSAEAFRRRPQGDEDGLSVSSTHEKAKEAFERGHGVAALRIAAIENLGLQLKRSDDDRGLICGLPDYENFDLAMNLADKLVSISTFTLDPWRPA